VLLHITSLPSPFGVGDLGPAGGDRGGRIIAEGTPEEIADHPTSFTGQFLRHILRAREAIAAD
jgi:excinuclease ABC subunit A